MLFALSHTWMDVNRGDRGIVGTQSPLNLSILTLVALVDIEIFRADVKVLLFTLSEVKSMCIDRKLVVTAGRN